MATMMVPSRVKKQTVNPSISAFLTTDERAMAKQIEATHHPTGFEINMAPLLQIVEDILSRASISPSQETMKDSVKQPHPELDAVSFIIDRVTCEISCKCLGGKDVHSTTISLLQTLEEYHWDAKPVIAMAAFALNYGEFWLLAQIHTSNSLGNAMAILRKVPSILQRSPVLKPRFDALNSLVQEAAAATRCIVEFHGLEARYFSGHDAPPAYVSFSKGLPISVYWIIRAIVVCALQIIAITDLAHECTTVELWDISSLTNKIGNMVEEMKNLLLTCYEHIESERSNEDFQKLMEELKTHRHGNTGVLKQLIYDKDDFQSLGRCPTMEMLKLDVLTGRNVLLLISSIEIPLEMLSRLQMIYESKESPTREESNYDIIWIPVIDRSTPFTDSMKQQLGDLRSRMPWYTVKDPLLIRKAALRCMKEVWSFHVKPILVAIDGEGVLVSRDASHMMWIWGNMASPFSNVRESALWKDETWKLELLVNQVDKSVLNWIKNKKYIILYGGSDREWIRKFTTSASEVAKEANVDLEKLYVGYNGKKEHVQKIIDTIGTENVGSFWKDPSISKFFWTRLESMLLSKIRQEKGNADDEVIIQQIMKLMGFQKVDGWALLAKGSEILFIGRASPWTRTLNEFKMWMENVPGKGFSTSIKEHIEAIGDQTVTCSHLELPSSNEKLPEFLKCPECFRRMERYVSFVCCHDEH